MKKSTKLEINNSPTPAIKMLGTGRFSRKGSYDVSLKVPSFKVKTLCEEGISVDKIDSENSNAAVDIALGAVGSLESKNKHDVIIKVSIKDGVEVINKKRKNTIYSYKINQVGYCNVDKRYPQIFVFIAAKEKTDLKCHIFLCDDIPKARAICLAFAKTFQNSYSNWKKSKEMLTADITDDKQDANYDRRKSAGAIQIPKKAQLEKRRASDFVTGRRKLDVRRSSADAVHGASSDEDTCQEDAHQIFEDLLSRSAEDGTCTLLGSGCTAWDSTAKNKE